jgi:uncharacterized membrane protein YccF (DUF307 family)
MLRSAAGERVSEHKAAPVRRCGGPCIPLGWAHLKLAALALWPIGRIIVPNEVTALPYEQRY